MRENEPFCKAALLYKNNFLSLMKYINDVDLCNPVSEKEEETMSLLILFVVLSYFKEPIMKHTTRIALFTLAISGLLTGRNVLAVPANAVTTDKPNPASE
jgi:hypothetical protein